MPGTVIKNHREFKNLSQKYVADKMGISQNAYSKIENNLTQLTVQHIKQLAEIFDVPILQLVKAEFEIHKPSSPHEISKMHVVEKLEGLRHSLQSKKEANHNSYLVICTLLQAVEEMAQNIM